jgi:hypothetical protein
VYENLGKRLRHGFTSFQIPGRCPGLSHDAPLGLETDGSLGCRQMVQSPKGAHGESPGQRPGNMAQMNSRPDGAEYCASNHP